MSVSACVYALGCMWALVVLSSSCCCHPLIIRFKRGEDTVRLDRGAATSKEAPDFFHVPGVPRAQLNAYGGYDFDYDHGSFGQVG